MHVDLRGDVADETVSEMTHFDSKPKDLLRPDTFDSTHIETVNETISTIGFFMRKGSGQKIKFVKELEVKLYKVKPLMGRTYMT